LISLAHTSSINKYRADRNLNQWLRGLLVQINDVFAAFMQFLGRMAPLAQPGVKAERPGQPPKACA
jgi:hypothetical protein